MSDKQALRPYLEAIEKHCQSLSKRELVDLIRSLAEEVPAKERGLFAAKILKPVPEEVEEESGTKVEKILAEIDELMEVITERREAIEDGTLWDDYDEEGYSWDEEPELVAEEHVEKIASFFGEARRMFLGGESHDAVQIYEQLIGLLEEEFIDYGYETSGYRDAVNLREVFGEYCRCVYEVSTSEQRKDAMLYALRVADKERNNTLYRGYLPSLRDVYNAKTGEMPEWLEFLAELSDELRPHEDERSLLLLLEALHWLHGWEKAAAEVYKRKNGAGYLFVLNQIEKEQLWEELARVAQRGLIDMDSGDSRVRIAEKLALAGERLADSELRMRAERERFFSKPTEEHLQLLVKEAGEQGIIEKVLSEALIFLEHCTEKGEHLRYEPLIVKILLLLGDLQGAYERADTSRMVGWSYTQNTMGLIFACVLKVLVGGDLQAGSINGLFDRYVSMRYASGEDLIKEEILARLKAMKFTPAQKNRWFAFLEKTVTGRVDHIVSNKHRNAYDRAAQAMGGYMECLILNGRKKKADDFLELTRNRKYNRFPAFRREVDEVLRLSPL